MSTGIDIEFVRQSYQKMTDEQLVRVATQDAAGLTPEAQEVVKEEIQRRKLDSNIVKGVKAQNRSYTIEDIDKYCEIIQKQNCPTCQSSFQKLNGTMTDEVVSYIFFTQYKKKIKIGCPDCLDKANNAALIKTATLGWWAIPWGIVRTIQSIALNLKSKKTNHIDTPNNFLRNFVLSKVGQLETYKDDKEKVQQLISVQQKTVATLHVTKFLSNFPAVIGITLSQTPLLRVPPTTEALAILLYQNQ
jgi:hypothetical protein